MLCATGIVRAGTRRRGGDRTMSLILTCDIGGTNFRVALIDRAGRTVTRHQFAGDDAAEPHPERWWHSFADAVAAVADTAGDAFATVAAIAIGGITRTQVFLDAAGTPLRPAITWRDGRAVAQAARLRDMVPPDWPEAEHINAFHPLARIAWLAAHEPAAFARLAHVVDPKDYLNLRLTGRIATDTVSGARLRAASQPYDRDGRTLLGAIGCPDSVGAIPFLAPTSRLGVVRAGLPGALGRLEGVPVFAMGNDTWAMAVGLGALRAGLAYNISGTSEVFGVIGAKPAAAHGLMAVDWGDGTQQLGGPSQSGADTVAWLHTALGAPADADLAGWIAALTSRPRDTQPALFLPFLQGERTPYWEPALRGAWLGLNRRHGPADLAFAVLEGIAFLNRAILERAEAALGLRAAEIRFGGGGAANAAWCQIKADVTGRRVVVGAAEQPGLLGAAIVAWAGLGAFPDLGAAQDGLVRPAQTHLPDAARHAAYAPLFAAWTQAVDATRAVSGQLAAMRI
jgi:xylulokinase